MASASSPTTPEITPAAIRTYTSTSLIWAKIRLSRDFCFLPANRLGPCSFSLLTASSSLKPVCGLTRSSSNAFSFDFMYQIVDTTLCKIFV
ncbi:hypothetical protein D3C75_797700 [compost metagenome]